MKQKKRHNKKGNEKMKNHKLLTLTIIALLIQATLITLAKAEPTPIPGDPGATPETSIRVWSNITYLQSLNQSDTEDVYNFTAYKDHWINITLWPPPDTVLGMHLKDPTFQARASTYPSNTTQYINFKCTVDGVWFLDIYLFSGPGGNYTFRIEPINFPPATPEAPSGPSICYVYNDSIFSTVTTDVENDSLDYFFDWDDGTITPIYSRLSGQVTNAIHQYLRPTDNVKTAYNIKIRARDNHGNYSDWSTATNVIVRQNDDNSGNDTSNFMSGARYIYRYRFDDEILTSKGTLYNDTVPKDLNDWYNFTAAINDSISVTMTPPLNANFDLELWNPIGESITSNNPNKGQKESITWKANVAGNWSIRIFIPNWINSGSGQYTFTLTISGYHLILKASIYPPEGLNFTIDGITYHATQTQPVDVVLPEGLYTIKAQGGFIIWYGDYGYGYTFLKWSDGVTSNQRTINLTQNTTLTAIYKRWPYPIYLY